MIKYSIRLVVLQSAQIIELASQIIIILYYAIKSVLVRLLKLNQIRLFLLLCSRLSQSFLLIRKLIELPRKVRVRNTRRRACCPERLARYPLFFCRICLTNQLRRPGVFLLVREHESGILITRLLLQLRLNLLILFAQKLLLKVHSELLIDFLPCFDSLHHSLVFHLALLPQFLLLDGLILIVQVRSLVRLVSSRALCLPTESFYAKASILA